MEIEIAAMSTPPTFPLGDFHSTEWAGRSFIMCPCTIYNESGFCCIKTTILISKMKQPLRQLWEQFWKIVQTRYIDGLRKILSLGFESMSVFLRTETINSLKAAAKHLDFCGI